MTRHHIPTLQQRQLAARMSFQRSMRLGNDAMFLASGCIDAPDVFVAQWDPLHLYWRTFNIRTDEPSGF